MPTAKRLTSHARLRVPPDTQQYTLRRVWLSKEEEDGFYSGFSNEGIWPLCHIAHTRPIFRAEDWKAYQTVNQRFAEAALEEMKGVDNPVILVQDYHFALLPRLIKEKRPDARVAIFWHIPWPNPEAFGICPWQHELLDGLLGADLIGFHIQSHCNNFLESVDRTLECRLEWERFAVELPRRPHHLWCGPFPISVPMVDEPSRAWERNGHVKERRDGIIKKLGLKDVMIGVGVDRLDYTKGIPERLRNGHRARFLDDHSRYYRGAVHIPASGRSHPVEYQAVSGSASRGNRRSAAHQRSIRNPIMEADRAARPAS